MAIGLNALVPRLKRLSPASRSTLGRLVPFAAVATAGVLNVFLMRGEEIRKGIDVYTVPDETTEKVTEDSKMALGLATGPELHDKADSTIPTSLGKSPRAATIAVGETAASRVFNATPIMILPPLILVRLQQQHWLRSRPRLVLPVNLGLILTTSIFALPLALAVFPQKERVRVERLEKEFVEKVGKGKLVEFNRGI